MSNEGFSQGGEPNMNRGLIELASENISPGEGLAKNVLRYLRHNLEYGLHYTRYHAVLEGYSDANWIFDTKGSKSSSGYVFNISGGAVSWRSSKQTCIARSTMESEFIALDKAAEEAEWLRNFLEDIPCLSNPVPAIMIQCDSQSVIARAHNTMYNGKSRHIRRRYNSE
ncbi:secreted RxLR effector protein 161-like [Henckelia pumila]|uniref:secreted RxLR effector protein 161-like n=1 Tax=Henckelia pumila TaxID=405737 RepID=UPI003C6EA357